jgi:hypothetical protein
MLSLLSPPQHIDTDAYVEVEEEEIEVEEEYETDPNAVAEDEEVIDELVDEKDEIGTFRISPCNFAQWVMTFCDRNLTCVYTVCRRGLRRIRGRIC